MLTEALIGHSYYQMKYLISYNHLVERHSNTVQNIL